MAKGLGLSETERSCRDHRDGDTVCANHAAGLRRSRGFRGCGKLRAVLRLVCYSFTPRRAGFLSSVKLSLRNRDGLRAYKFSFQLRLTVFEQHGDDFLQIQVQLLQRRALRMSTGKAGNVADEQFRFRATLDYCRECFHNEINLAVNFDCCEPFSAPPTELEIFTVNCSSRELPSSFFEFQIQKPSFSLQTHWLSQKSISQSHSSLHSLAGHNHI